MRDIESAAIALAQQGSFGAFAHARRARLPPQVCPITDFIFLNDAIATLGFRRFLTSVGSIFVCIRPAILASQDDLPHIADRARKMEGRIGQAGNRIPTCAAVLRIVVRHDTAVRTARSRADILRRLAFAHAIIAVVAVRCAVVQAAAAMPIILNLTRAVTA